MLVGLFADPASAEGKALEKAGGALAEAGPRARFDAYDLPLRELTVWDYEKPDAAAEAMFKLFQASKAGMSYQAAVLKADPKVTAAAQTHRGIKLHSVTMTWDLAKTVEGSNSQLPEDGKKQLIELMKKLLGEGTTVWFGSDGKRLVQITAGNWQSARNLLDVYLDGKDTLGAEQTFGEVRKRLPAEATGIVLYDAPRYTTVFYDSFLIGMQAVGGPVQLPPLGPAPGKPSYAVTSVDLQAGRAGADLWLPATTVRNVHKMIEPAIKKFRGQGIL
jgi:hypothetical protein